MRRVTFAVVVSLAVLLGTGVVVQTQAADPSWLGTWKLNLTKSKYEPASLAPKSNTSKSEAFEGGVRTTGDVVDAQGKSTHTDITYKFDGKDSALKGAATANTTRAYTRIDNRSYSYVTKVDGKVTTTLKIVVAADGKSRTITTTGKNAEGQTVNNVAVWDKQ